MSTKNETITLAGGCFWCTEAVFQRLKGVKTVTSGYTGGEAENPTYEKVSEGTTNHAEAIQIEFDPDIISLETLLDVFWHTHDPTTLNRQGADTGTQYRSAIFYHTEKQKEVAEKSKARLVESGEFKDPVVTEIVAYTGLYKAEDYHQNFYEQNQNAPYCQLVINPKIQKLLKDYKVIVK